MRFLVVESGKAAGSRFPLGNERSIIGRDDDSDVVLSDTAVSRHHAEIVTLNGTHFLKDLGSRNGTFVNDAEIKRRVPLTPGDRIQVGPYHLVYNDNLEGATQDVYVREKLNLTGDQSLYDVNPSQKLRLVMEIAQHLACNLSVNDLLVKLLDHLLTLFPQADRALVLLCEGDDKLMVRGDRYRRKDVEEGLPYSRTIVQMALREGVGVISEDVSTDQRFQNSMTLQRMSLQSILCVPLISKTKKRLGVLHLDSTSPGALFAMSDLQLLSILALQVAVEIENAELHATVLREELLRRDLDTAREIQQGFLPSEFPRQPGRFEVFASLHPARYVSGDLYDFLPLADGKLAFFVGDVSGKGIPAAMFMVVVRTLCRHVVRESDSPANTLMQLSRMLAADNSSDLFVTIVHGVYDPPTGGLVLASGGHPCPLLRRSDGTVTQVELPTAGLVGHPLIDLEASDTRLTLGPGETLVCYTDGYIEAKHPVTKECFDVSRLQAELGGPRTPLPLPQCAAEIRAAVERYTGSTEQQDDLTMLLLRRDSGLPTSAPGETAKMSVRSAPSSIILRHKV